MAGSQAHHSIKENENPALNSHHGANTSLYKGKNAVEREFKDNPGHGKTTKGTNAEFLSDDEVIEPTTFNEFARTVEKIYENYPFCGRLLKKHDRHYRMKKIISKDSPLTIEDVETNYGPGKYQLRLLDANEQEHNLSFEIEEPEAEQPAHQPETKDKATENLEAIISSLEKRLETANAELDEKSRKIRSLNEEVAESELRAQRRVNHKVEAQETKIEELKDEIWDLKRQRDRLELEQEFHGEKSTLSEIADRILGNDNLLSMFAPILNGGMNPGPAPAPNALAGAQTRENPNEETEHHTNGQQQTEEEPMQAQQQMTPHQLMQNFVQAIYNRAVQALMEDEPQLQEVKTFVDENLAAMQQNGVPVPAQAWINISKALIEFVDQNNIASEKLADIIQPILGNAGKAKKMLGYMKPESAADAIKDYFELNITDKERSILVDVLTIFKQRISS